MYFCSWVCINDNAMQGEKTLHLSQTTSSFTLPSGCIGWQWHINSIIITGGVSAIAVRCLNIHVKTLLPMMNDKVTQPLSKSCQCCHTPFWTLIKLALLHRKWAFASCTYICQNKNFALLREILNYVCKVSSVLSERICIGEHDCYWRVFEIF